MHVVTDSPTPVAARGAIVAIGNFDGVHRGHQALIARASAAARARCVPAGAVLFEPHPREFFRPDEPQFRLAPLPEKLRILEGLGLDMVRVLTFDETLSHMSAEAFVADVLVGDLAISGAVVGYDFFFGHKRAGTPQRLSELGAAHGFAVDIVAPIAEDGAVFSSSALRLQLAAGDIRAANLAMGRNWRVTGTVVGGAKRGTGMGYPTANVPMPKGTALAHGIFAVRLAILDGGTGGAGATATPIEWHDGAAYLGTRPTFDDGKPVLEVFVLDFDGDLYGRTIAVEFVDYIRPDRKFESVEALVAQMDRDVAAVRRVLGAA
jgi:riboflavin kinase/FMN adenylyltransferase